MVAPYKPHTDNEDTNSISTDKAPLLGNITHTNGKFTKEIIFH